MIETEWLTCSNPDQMLYLLKNEASERKLRLFAAACCRRIWRFMEDEHGRRAVESAEAFADGEIGGDVIRKIAGMMDDFVEGFVHDGAAYAAANAAFYSVFNRCSWVENACSQSQQAVIESVLAELKDEQRATAAAEQEQSAQCDLLRDIFGVSPYRSRTVDVAWLTPTVVGLAQSMYASRSFDQMSLLADTLEAAGCRNADLLEHCRGSGPHVRGCWVIDMILGKE